MEPVISHKLFQMPIIRRFPGLKSFLVDDFLNENLRTLALRVVTELTEHDLHSEFGIKVACDKPLGSKTYKLNIERPAVLRQFFGLRAKDEVFCYGDGVGSTTVGTHPHYKCTREMTPQMKHLAHILYKRMIYLQQSENLLSGIDIEPFNHCTILFFFHKNNNSNEKMLGLHTDNVYSRKGEFVKEKNSQKENTITCSITVGDSRKLTFQRECSIKSKVTKHDKWVPCYERSITLHDKSLFVLNPRDEYSTEDFKFRWRHGILHFSNKNAISIAFVFRTVIHKEKAKPSEQDLGPLTTGKWKTFHTKLNLLVKNRIA